MNVDTVGALLHLAGPHNDGSVGVLRRVVEVEHLEALVVTSDEGCLNVLKLVLAFALLKELVHLVDQHQLDRLALVNDALGVVDVVGAGEVYRVPVLQKRDLHRAHGDLEEPLVQAQPLDGPLYFLVDRLPELVVALPDDDGASVDVLHDLKDGLDGRLAGLGPGSS